MLPAPVLAARIVALLDVLGFRAHLQQYATDSGRGLQLYYEAWSRASAELGSAALRWTRRVLTDNIVLVGDSVGQEKAALLDFVLAVGRFQFEFALSGFFVRGGVCLNEYAEQGEFIYGAALAEAYDIEQRAEYPRVVVSRALASIARSDGLITNDVTSAVGLADLADEHSRLPFIRVEKDVPYVDYLLAAHQTADDEMLHQRNVRKHAARIAQGQDFAEATHAKVFADPSSTEKQKDAVARLVGKYRWLHTYHDSYCRLAQMPKKCWMSEQGW